MLKPHGVCSLGGFGLRSVRFSERSGFKVWNKKGGLWVCSITTGLCPGAARPGTEQLSCEGLKDVRVRI